jgi:SAM-dependent methyltransferase
MLLGKLIRRLRRLATSEAAVRAEMRRDWDDRARTNARYYVATLQDNWADDDFFESGRIWVRHHVLPDLPLICRDRPASEMRVLEIGCGAGRMTRALSEIFGSVDAIDISPEMIAHARRSLKDLENVRVHVTNGTDIAAFGDGEFDFVFSAIVFQHIPRKSIVANYLKETWRVLRPGSVFKFQVKGIPMDEDYADSWEGVGFSADEMRVLASRFGFNVHSETGARTQYYWLTCIRLSH